MRTLINKYGLPAAISFLVLAALFAWLWSERRGNVTGDQTRAFFVDEESGEEVVRPASDLPPVVGKSGRPTLVKAIKYGCKGNNPEVLYWMKYTPEALAALQSLPADDARRADIDLRGQLVRSPKAGSAWVPLRSREGDLVTRVPDCPDGSPMQAIYPR